MTVASEISRLQCAKSCIKASIEGKGVTVGSSLKLDSYYSCINAIPAAVYLTQQEYDALPSSKLTDGVPYGIMSNGKVSKFIRNGTEYNPLSFVNYIVVGGGGGGGAGGYDSKGYAGGGGGGGEVLIGCLGLSRGSYNIVIGSGGVGSSNGGNTCFGGIVANGGCSGGDKNAVGGISGSGCTGGSDPTGCAWGGGGGGGATGNGCNGPGRWLGGNGGPGLCGYGGGGGGGATYKTDYGCGVDGGGNGSGCMSCSVASISATNYGGGGGGGSNGNTSTSTVAGGNGCQGLVEICYTLDGTYGITCATGGDCCYTCDGYCVHRFTSDGTFTIVS